MDKLVIKEVDFNGTLLMAVQDKDQKIYVGVKWICKGLGLNDNQRIAQMKKIREDVVLAKGVIKKLLPTSSGKQEVLCIELHFLPLWLAKINANIVDKPAVQTKIIEYQLHAADVLAGAFIKSEGGKSKYKEIDAELRQRNTNIREANMYYKLADKYPYNSRRQVLYGKAVEVLSGEKLEPTYTVALFDDSLN